AAVAARLGAPAPAAARAALGHPDPANTGFGGGTGYNLAALLGAGSAYAMLDDDFVLPLSLPGDAMPGLDFDAVPDSTTRFFDSADAALAAGIPLASEPFVHALGVCGGRLGDIWQLDPWRVTRDDLAGFAPSRLPRINADARIATLTHGHRGDSGAQSTRWMYLLDDASRRAFAADAERYARNLEGGAVWFGPERARIDAQTAFTPFAVDARQFVPPTVAGGRSEDLVFGALVAACDPGCVALHSNLTIGHRQERARLRSATLADASTPVSNQWLADLLTSASPELHADTPSRRVVSLGNVLRDAAASSPARRLEMVSDYLRYARADMASRLAAARDAAGDAPDFWRRDVDRMIEAQRLALLDPPPPRFSDWPADERDAAGRVALLLESFAAVLEAWPALLDHAAQCADSLLQD
ncbi:MAG TPA: hypothetical protein VND91_05105, partial [Candidatus Saccharimonadia bacterium]|nr:hypothetical protein [Candidatus Saccharimonadia bacterium]